MKLFGIILFMFSVSKVFAKDEYLVSGIKSDTSHPFGLSPGWGQQVPHDRCAVSIPVPGNDDSFSIVTLGIDHKVWIKKFDGESWGEWVCLNGQASSGPSAIKDEKGQLHIFIRGFDGLIWHRFEKDNEWSEWMHLGNVTTTSGPLAVINSEGLISVFAIGSNKAVWVNNQEGLKDSEGVCTSGKKFPTADQEANDNNAKSIVVSNSGFAEDSPNHKPVELVQVTQNSTSDELRKKEVRNATSEANREWSRVESLKTSTDSVSEIKYVWSGWENLGGVWTSKPAVCINHEGLLSVFIRGTDRSMYYTSQETSTEHGIVWSDFISLKGSFASMPKISCAVTSEGTTVLSARGLDKSFYIKKQVISSEGIEWDKWESAGGLWSSGPTVLNPYGDSLDLFGVGVDLSVWHKVYSPDSERNFAWSTPESLNGRFSSSVALIKDTSGQMKVIARGFDKQIWINEQTSDGYNMPQWGNWTSIGGATLNYP